MIFNSSETLNAYTAGASYGDQGVSRICFGVLFNETTGPNKYNYELRFNSSGMINYEIPPTNLDAIDSIKYEDHSKANTYWNSGMLTV
jgi:ATP-binding cassette subfamily A (ABC1) protein 3